MSGLFGLDDTGNQALKDEIAQNPILPDEVRPGFFAGIPKAIGKFPFQAAGMVAKGVELAGVVPSAIVGSLLAPQTDVPQKYFETFDPYVKGWSDYFTPDPKETGTAARVLGGFGQSATLLAAGGGNPALLIASTGLSGAMDLSDQGVSPDIAAVGGALEGAATALGFKVPFLGRTLPMRVASGAVGFAALNAATAEAQHQLLLATGYANLAAAYEPFNGTDRAIDLLVGGMFGAVHHFGAGGKPITAETRDAALALANARHAQIDTAPGFPADVQTAAIHQETIDIAMGQLLRDEPVTPPAALAEATFEPKPPTLTPEDVPADLKALDQTLRGELVTAPEAVQNALFAPRQVGLKEGLASAGAAIGENMREGLWQAYSSGKPKFAGLEDPALKAAVAAGVPTTDRAAFDQFLTNYGKGKSQAGAGATEGGQAGAAAPTGGGQTAAEGQGGGEKLEPAVQSATDLIAQTPDLHVATGNINADGTAETISAAEAMARTHQNIADAEANAKAFDAAVNCAAQRGTQ